MAAPRPKRTYGPPEPKNRVKLIIGWLFVLLCIAGIVWMIMKAPKDHGLVCDQNSPHSLTYFGTCSDGQ